MEDIKFQSSMPKEIVPTLVRSQYRIKLYQHIAVRNAVPFPFNIYNNDNSKTKPQQSQEVNDIRLGCEVILVKNCSAFSFVSVQTVFTDAKRRVSWKKAITKE